MGLYLSSGYLNQTWISEQADKNNISFIVEIGGRQVGKTYGTLELMLREDKRFILMRRTLTELEFICNDLNNPFVKYSFQNVTVNKDSKYTGAIMRKGDTDTQIGSVMSLSSVAKIRGFNGSVYTDLVFDEFIPENHVTKIRDEGDAFLNALVTISGNRELEGQKPLRVWLLANANNIASPILDALNLQQKIARMIADGQELSILPERGIMIVLPHSDELMARRRDTALMRAVNGESKFTRMAFDNQFAYNDDSNIRAVKLSEYRPVYQIAGEHTLYKHKSTGMLYVTGYCNGGCKIYMDTDRHRTLVRKRYANLRELYVKGRIFFSDLPVKEKFIAFLYE